MDTTPIWKIKEMPTRYPALASDLDVEVLVIGGEDHETGQRIRGAERLNALETRLSGYLGPQKITQDPLKKTYKP